VGQQLLCKHSEEGDTECIGIFDAEVKRFQPHRHEEKVPCMGWNKLSLPQPLQKEGGVNPLYKGILSPLPLEGAREAFVYFVHSYYVPVCQHTIATADYILPYSASMHKDNFYTCQFHPEKSGKVGEQIIKNFLEL
jgi:glutamine amidotransferase